MASSRACASACASRAPGAESVKGHDAALAADPNAALAKGGVFGAKRKHLAEWKGSKNQDDCALGGTIGGAPALRCPPCPGVLARSAAPSAPPPQRHTPQPYSRRAPAPATLASRPPSRSESAARATRCLARPESRRMASSRACASACASRAPGAESVKGHDAALAADPTAALQKSGVFSGNVTLLAEWKGSKKQDDCSKLEGATISAKKRQKRALLKRFTGKLCSEGLDCCGMCSKLPAELRAVQPAHSQGLGMCWDCARIAREKAVECSKNI
jgi:hypothetical protein